MRLAGSEYPEAETTLYYIATKLTKTAFSKKTAKKTSYLLFPQKVQEEEGSLNYLIPIVHECHCTLSCVSADYRSSTFNSNRFKSSNTANGIFNFSSELIAIGMHDTDS
ncbi:hypothetical protein SAMN05443252_10633 [Bacillus sp. OV322]|nr:hypothetical protein SAMN05443252_10633 [Bacillus sp. OV322]